MNPLRSAKIRLYVKRVTLVFLFLIGFANPAGATDFGQNKVQYHPFNWSFLQTEHFDIYFPQDADPIARFAATRVEGMYKDVSTLVGHKLGSRVPIILHNSHAEFEQTNVIRMNLQEGIGGFTEIFKNRIVLPFEGSYTDLFHVLKHEMTHAIVFDMLFGEQGVTSMARQTNSQFPLWVSEGLAEYTSLGWDLGSEFFMVDATTFGYVAPPTVDFGGFLAYKGGQLFLHWMDQAYGKGTVTRFIAALREEHEMPLAFKKTTKTSLEEAGEIWLRELRYLYWPELGQRQYGKSVARQLTQHGKDNSFYNLQPSISPDGKEIAFFSDRESWEAIYILNVKSEKVTRTVIQGGKESKHESFHSFKSAMAWSPDGKQLAIVSKSEGRDVIHLIDVKNGKVNRELRPDVQAILSPDWSRDGQTIAFSACKAGITDLFVFDLESNTTRQLTHDLANDDKPVFSPSGRYIAFESDRPVAAGDVSGDPLKQYDSLQKFKDLYRVDLKTGQVEIIAGGRWDEKMPSYGPNDSLIAFVSNRSGIDNIYQARDSAGTWLIHPMTNLLTGCFTPAWSRDGKTMAFSLFEAGGWDIYLLKDPAGKVMSQDLPRSHFIQSVEDSGKAFFRPVTFANLESFNKDSLEEKSKKNKKEKQKEQEKEKAKESTGEMKAVDADSIKSKTDTLATRVITDKQVDSALAGKTRKQKATPFLLDSGLYLNAQGDYKKKPYRPIFSLDNANAALGVDNYYGAGGMAYITMSDLMGDQEIATALSINGSWDNTNGEIIYSYLPLKPDFSVSAFHRVQETIRFTQTNNQFDSTFLDRRWGFGGQVAYPLSPFTRVEGNASTFFAASEFQNAGNDSDRTKHSTHTDALFTSMAYVHDHTQWGMVGPVNGLRARLQATYVPPALQSRFSYGVIDADIRRYFEFGKKYTLALRLSGGASEAVGDHANPHKYWVGGEDLTFNPHVYSANIPDKQDDWYFGAFDFPLRGYDFFEFTGTRKLLGNFEFRYPFIQEFTVLWPIPFSIRYVMGNVFVDYGGAWSQGNAFDQMGMGWGWGMRLNLGIFVLKYTWGQPVEGIGGHTNPAREYWSLGAEF
jgi:Tol biopolymer transport system component